MDLFWGSSVCFGETSYECENELVNTSRRQKSHSEVIKNNE